MTIFAVLMPAPQPIIAAEIERLFPTDHLKLSDTQYLISSGGTAIELSAKIGVYDVNEPSKPAKGNAVIFATSSYFGRAHTTVWDWIKAKLESPPRG
jgi:4-aminobutyrate aminotransferase-like enzyme